MSDKKLLLLLIPLFALSIIGINLSHYYSEYYIYSAWGRSLDILVFLLSWFALAVFLKIFIGLCNIIEKNKSKSLMVLAFSWLLTVPYLTFNNIDKIYENPNYNDLPMQARNYESELEKEISEEINKKIKNRHEKFVGKYTFKKYAQMIPIISAFHFTTPLHPFGVVNTSTIISQEDPYIDYLMKFDTKDECEKSLVKKFYKEFNECIKFEG